AFEQISHVDGTLGYSVASLCNSNSLEKAYIRERSPGRSRWRQGKANENNCQTIIHAIRIPSIAGHQQHGRNAHHRAEYLPSCSVMVAPGPVNSGFRSEEHTSELQSRENLVCRLLLEK